jgi:hypothetical protein
MQLNSRGEQRKVGRDAKPGALGLPESRRSLGNQDVRHLTPVDFRLTIFRKPVYIQDGMVEKLTIMAGRRCRRSVPVH